MSQIIRITSEALQATVRRLLPSQQGFGEDLQASNVITPIIDLTPTAEGSALPLELSTASAHSSNTLFQVSDTNTDVINTAGFYRVIGTSTVKVASGARFNSLRIVDASTTEVFWRHRATGGIANEVVCLDFDLNVFLRAGDTLNVSSSGVDCIIVGSVRQIADVYGNITNPTGFTFE